MLEPSMPVDIQGAAGQDSPRAIYKHLGKLKDGTKLAILFRSVPGDAYSALVVGPQYLESNQEDSFMKALQSEQGQKSYELGEYLSQAQFPDGVNILSYLHRNNFIKKISTDEIVVTMGNTAQGEIVLTELNRLIAEQKGVSMAELAVQSDIVDTPAPDLAPVESNDTTDS